MTEYIWEFQLKNCIVEILLRCKIIWNLVNTLNSLNSGSATNASNDENKELDENHYQNDETYAGSNSAESEEVYSVTLTLVHDVNGTDCEFISQRKYFSLYYCVLNYMGLKD